MSRRAAKVDAPHAAFVKLFRQLGATVFDTSGAGKGFPDLVCIIRGEWQLVEIKDGRRRPSQRRLTVAQEKFHAAVIAAGAKIHVVETGADVLRLMNAQEAA